jgi:glucose-6-phosphate isomerase
MDQAIEIAKTLFIVASKSGTTTEPDAFFRYYYEQVQKALGSDNAATSFIAITDPGTKLEKEATEMGFRKIWVNDPNIGGRYSALSYFGMVPAALAGVDVTARRDARERTERHGARGTGGAVRRGDRIARQGRSR